MYVTIGDKRFDFHKVGLDVLEMGIENTFAKFDKMTLKQLLEQKKYEHLKLEAEKKCDWLLDRPAGEALLELKFMGNPYYKQFLNNYGDLPFSRFVVKGNDELLQKNGVYNIIVNNELVFSGVCARAFKERFNQHIGNISAKGCYRDGTATHCHINARLTEAFDKGKIHFSICPMKDTKEMNQLKNAIIRRFEPTWNLRAGKEVSGFLRS
ncbi:MULTISPECIES: hypothetical protein [unclassified Lysinibacillus]|uniref:hypothetical protein n=1 Tax=unclassified Lysinibacillus TaxID=2636778 RepID=UPI0036E50C14